MKLFARDEIRYALYAVVAAILFGVVTTLLPARLSQRDVLFGYGSDSDVYWDLSGNIRERGEFVHSPGFDFAFLKKTTEYMSGTQRLPGYPVALAAVRVLTGEDSPKGPAIWVFNMLLVFANTYFIVSIFTRIVPGINPKLFWLVVLFPPFLMYSNGINVDFFSAVLLSGFVFFLLKENNLQWGSVVLAGVLTITRANAIFFVLPMLVLYFVLHRKEKHKALVALAGLLTVILVFAGWSLRNEKLSGKFVFVPYTGLQLRQNYINKLYRSELPLGEERFYRWKSVDFLKQRLDELIVEKNGNWYAAEAALDKEIIKDTITLLWQKKLAAIAIYARDVVQMFTNEYFMFNAARHVNTTLAWTVAWVYAIVLYTLPAFLLVGYAALSLLRRMLNEPTAIIYSAICYSIVTAGILGDFARYTVPVSMAILLSLSLTIMKLTGKTQNP